MEAQIEKLKEGVEADKDMEEVVNEYISEMEDNNGSSLHAMDGKVICDKDELVKHFRLVASFTAHQVLQADKEEDT